MLDSTGEFLGAQMGEIVFSCDVNGTRFHKIGHFSDAAAALTCYKEFLVQRMVFELWLAQVKLVLWMLLFFKKCGQ